MHLPRIVTVELHQIVHLPVNSAPARKRSHDSSSSHMKRNLHCAEQQEPPSDITKYSTLPAPKNDMPRKVALDLLLFCDCDFTIPFAVLYYITVLYYSFVPLFFDSTIPLLFYSLTLLVYSIIFLRYYSCTLLVFDSTILLLFYSFTLLFFDSVISSIYRKFLN